MTSECLKTVPEHWHLFEVICNEICRREIRPGDLLGTSNEKQSKISVRNGSSGHQF
jgi:hypothetical protein